MDVKYGLLDGDTPAVKKVGRMFGRAEIDAIHRQMAEMNRVRVQLEPVPAGFQIFDDVHGNADDVVQVRVV